MDALQSVLPPRVYTYITYNAAAFVSFFVCWFVYLYVSPALSSMLVPAYRTLKRGDKVDWNSRVVSSIHAVVVTIGTFFCLLSEDVWYSDPYGGYSKPAELYSHIFIGYLFYDMLLVLGNKEIRTAGTIAHHAIAIAAYTLSIFHYITQFFATLWLFTEISTPFINNRVFLKLAGKETSTLYLINGLMMAITFVGSRAIFAPIFGGYYGFVLRHKAIFPTWYTKVDFAISVVGMTSLNLYWSYLIIKGILKALSGGKSAGASGAHKAAGAAEAGRKGGRHMRASEKSE